MSRLMILFALVTAGAAAAEPYRQVTTSAPDQPETLFTGDVSHGGYGAARVGYGRIAGKDAVIVSGEGGWIINHSFIIGAAGYALATQQAMPGDLGVTDNLAFGYGGAMLGYTLLPEKLVHATLTVLVGAGGIGSYARVNLDHGSSVADAVFVLEPTLTVDLNMVKFMRTGLAVSYRYVSGVDAPNLSNADFSGFTGSFVMKFGKF